MESGGGEHAARGGPALLANLVVSVGGAARLVGGCRLSLHLRVSQLRRAHAMQETFSRRLIDSQERERKRIAGELHDSLGQSLAIIKNRALFGIYGATDFDAAKEQFNQISAQSSQAIDEVKEIAYNLRPYLLDRLGLTKSIEAMLNKVANSSAVQFSADLDSLDGLFLPEAEINFYRIVQESLNNIVKHAGGDRSSGDYQAR